MADQRLIRFIQEAFKKGNSHTQIEKVLVQKGWSAEQVKDAFTEVSHPTGISGKSSERKPLMKNPLFLVLLGLIVLLVITGIAYLFVSSGCDIDSDCDTGSSCSQGACVQDECITDSDCGRGEECSSGSCTTIQETTSDEPECSTDASCAGFACASTGNCYDVCVTDSECADNYECDAGSCEKILSTSSAIQGDENYELISLSLKSTSSIFSSYYVNISHDGDTESGDLPSLLCSLSLSGTEVNTSFIEEITSIDLEESSLEVCTIYSSSLYSSIVSSGNVTVHLNATVDSSEDINETDEDDNTLVEEFILGLEDFEVTSSTSCTDSSSCGTGYDCAVNGNCFDICTQYDLECAEGYSCDTDSSSCIADSAIVLAESCVSDLECTSGYTCESGNCVEESAEAVVCGDTVPLCADGEDNDADGYTDLDDTECTDWTSNEIGIEVYTCTDSDSSASDSFMEEGTVLVTDSYGNEVSNEVDGCLGDRLTEYSCTEDGILDFSQNLCTDLYGEDYTCSEGACALVGCFEGYTYDSTSHSCEADTSTACSDGIDNDADGMTDYYGGCDTGSDGETDLSCLEMLDSEFVSTLSDVSSYCETVCEWDTETFGGYEGTFYSADVSCSSLSDDEELAVCADGIDNDNDGSVDFIGGCDTNSDGISDISCVVDLIESLETESYCEYYCTDTVGGLSGEYIQADSNCVSVDDNAEALKGRFAPESSEGIFQIIFDFIFQAPSADAALSFVHMNA